MSWLLFRFGDVDIVVLVVVVLLVWQDCGVVRVRHVNSLDVVTVRLLLTSSVVCVPVSSCRHVCKGRGGWMV